MAVDVYQRESLNCLWRCNLLVGVDLLRRGLALSALLCVPLGRVVSFMACAIPLASRPASVHKKAGVSIPAWRFVGSSSGRETRVFLPPGGPGGN